MTGLAAGLYACLGLLIGSFLNVVIWRVPRGESVVSPPSACPRCGHRIAARDNVPIVSWLALRGRCRSCGAPISARYPLVEASTAVLFALVGLRVGFSWAAPAYLYLAAIGVALTMIDLDVHRLPDRIVLPSYPVLVVLLAVASWSEADFGALLRAAIGGAALFAFYFVVMVVYPAGMGFGDAKLAGLLGLALGWIGWGALVVGAFAAFLVGGLLSIALLVTHRATRKSGIPFGPFMVLGAAIGIAVGQPAWAAYLAVLG